MATNSGSDRCVEEAWRQVFPERNYAQAAHFYDCGQDAHVQVSERVEQLRLSAISVEHNDFQSIAIDISNNMSLAINQLVKSRRRGPGHLLANVSLRQLDLSLREADYALVWPGISDHQRKKAHFNRALAYRNKADWEKHAWPGAGRQDDRQW